MCNSFVCFLNSNLFVSDYQVPSKNASIFEMLTLATCVSKYLNLYVVNVSINHCCQELGGHKPWDGDVGLSQVSIV